MTYSNTNWDRVQVLGVTLVAGVLIVSALVNIAKQYGAIEESKLTERDLSTKITELKEENSGLRQKLEYATSSAAKERRLRGVMGVGTENDYWIEFPPEAKTFTK